MTVFAKIFPNEAFVDILSFFLFHPDEEIHQHGLVQLTGRALMQIQRIVARLEKTGLILKRKLKNRVYYRANRSHPALEDVKRACLKGVVFGDALSKRITPIQKKIVFGFIYGSVASGKEVSTSDIDLFLVADLTIREISKILGPLSRKLKRECNVAAYSLETFLKHVEEKTPFFLNVIHGPKIWLFGDEQRFKTMVG